MRVAPAIELTDTTRKELKKAARSNTSSVRFARRAKGAKALINQSLTGYLPIAC